MALEMIKGTFRQTNLPKLGCLVKPNGFNSLLLYSAETIR